MVSLNAKGSQRGMKEFAGGAIGGDDAAVVGGLGDVAARASGHQDLTPAFLFFSSSSVRLPRSRRAVPPSRRRRRPR